MSGAPHGTLDAACPPELAAQLSLAPTDVQCGEAPITIEVQQLVDFYCHHAPERIKDVADIMTHYNGRHAELRDALTAKYKTAPVYPHFFGLNRRQQEFVVGLLRAQVDRLCCPRTGLRTVLRQRLAAEQASLWRAVRRRAGGARCRDEVAVLRLTAPQREAMPAYATNGGKPPSPKQCALPRQGMSVAQLMESCGGVEVLGLEEGAD